MRRKPITFSIPWPSEVSRLALTTYARSWLPTRGNVLFTVLIVAGLLWANSAGAFFASAPSSTASSVSTIPYQGRLADSAGNPLTSTVNMEFRLYSAASGSTPLWSELWTGSNGVQVSDGLFNVMLGSLAPIPQSAITANSSLWLGITVGTDGEMAPRVQLGSVPYAVQALTVPDASIASAKLADSSVTALKLATNSVTTNKLADGSVTQQKAPTLIQSLSGQNVKVYFGSDSIPITVSATRIQKTVTTTAVCPHTPLVFLQPSFNYYDDVIATIGSPLSGTQFTVYLNRSNGGAWQIGQGQEFSWMAICN